ncbi:MAG: hypothetical protein DRJ05_19115, partial [Bacteroidetes bacterium]
MRIEIVAVFAVVCLFNINVNGQSPDRPQSRIDSLNFYSKKFCKTNFDSAGLYAQKALELSNKIDYPLGRIMATINLAEAVFYKGSLDSALVLYELVIAYPNEDKYRKHKFMAYQGICKIYYYKGEYYKAMVFIEKAINELPPNLVGEFLGSALNMKGLIYKRTGNLEKAQQCLIEALSYADIVEDNNLRSIILTNLGIINRNLEQYDKALEYYDRALIYLKIIEDIYGIGMIYQNLGSLYADIEKYDKALEYNFKAKAIVEKTNYKSINFATVLNNIGLDYFYLHKSDSAIVFFNKAIKLSGSLEDAYGVADSKLNLGRVYVEKKNHKTARRLIEEGIGSAKKIDAIDVVIEGYKALVECEVSAENYKAAFSAQALLDVLHDSIYNIEKVNAINELQEKYESEKKEKQIITLKAEKDLQTAQSKNKTYLIALLVLIILIAGILTIFYLKNQKNKYHRKLLEEREKEAEAQKRRFAKELHDGTGSNLTGIRLQLLSLKGKVGDDNKIKQLINEVERTHQGIRLLAYQALPPEFGKYTLDGAISDLVRRLSKTGSVKINYSSILDLDWGQTSQEFQLALYRIVQEALSNIFKHANAQNINIQIIQHETDLNIMIEDDGKGFDSKTESKGIGLANMRERTEGLGGEFNIDSTAGNGTTVIVDVPLD